jgi:hypothetical protein
VADRRLTPVLPSEVLAALPPVEAPASLATAALPLPTKKQEKYNVLRWAATGRDDLGINSRCYRLAQALTASPSAREDDWRELCFLYASDFRTHITDRRWAAYQERLIAFEARWVSRRISSWPGLSQPSTPKEPVGRPVRSLWERTQRAGRKAAERVVQGKPGHDMENQSEFIRLEAGSHGVELNPRRGLAIQRFWRDASEEWLIGTVPFGYYDDISLSADFYSGHVVFQQPGRAQVTDLSPVEPWFAEDDVWRTVGATVPTSLGPIEKEVRLHRRLPRLDVLFRLAWPGIPMGILRLGHVTANPEAFAVDRLWYETHNGGTLPERFALGGVAFDHGQPVSHLVSARTALGMTEGLLRFGDDQREVAITVLRDSSAVVPMIIWRPLPEGYFFRVSFSAGEIDDTLKPDDSSRAARGAITLGFSLTLGPGKEE